MTRTRGAAAALALLASLVVACSQAGQTPTTRAVTTSPGTTSPSTTPSASAGPGNLAVAHPTVWLCRPGMPDDPCAGALDATVVAADGSRTRQAARPAVDPSVDCFYVYPTVSTALTVNAPLRAGAAEKTVARAQAAPFSRVCRVFAPVYRQLTLKALVTGAFGQAEARALAHSDVVSAWHDYLAHHNQGRPFVLIGHSQGSLELLRLIREEIDGNPDLRGRMLSALLIGGRVMVPPGRDVGGEFAHVPACRRPDQTGCVVGYNSFQQAPPPNSWFGRPSGGLEVLCVNPAALAGGAAWLHPYLPVTGYATPYVTFAQGVRAQCRRQGGVNWLQVDVQPWVADRAFETVLGPEWGLHRFDVSLALGDLVTLVEQQAAAAAARATP